MRLTRLKATVVAGFLLFLLMTSSTAGQTPGGPGGGAGGTPEPGPFGVAPPPPGGIGLMVVDREQDREQLLLQLRLQDCDPKFLAITTQGRWLMYIPGAPDFVNSEFPPLLRIGDAFMVGCANETIDLKLREVDNGTTVTLGAGDRVRVILSSNASTGFRWVVKSAPNPAVLAPVGGPFYVPAATDLVGAPGNQVFDYRAVASGSTSISLSYERVGTTEPPAGTWSVNVTVR